MAPSDISAAWNQIEALIAKNNLNGLPALNPPASEDELGTLSRALSLELPEDLKASLKTHNGELDTLGLTLTLDCERIEAEYAVQMKLREDFSDYSRHSPDSAVNDVFWDPHWIPIAADGSGNLWCIDTNPTTKGKMQQIIYWDHEGACDVEADTLANFLLHQADEVTDEADWLEEDGILSVDF